MSLKALMMLLIFWLFMSLLFFFTHNALAGITTTAPPVSSAPAAPGSLVDTLIFILQLIAFVFIGVGLPTTTPAWFAVMFAGAVSLMNAFALGFLIQSARGG